MLGREEGAEAAAGGGLGLAEEEGDWALKEVGKMERPGQGAGEQAGFGDLSAAGEQAAVGGGAGGASGDGGGGGGADCSVRVGVGACGGDSCQSQRTHVKTILRALHMTATSNGGAAVPRRRRAARFTQCHPV